MNQSNDNTGRVGELARHVRARRGGRGWVSRLWVRVLDALASPSAGAGLLVAMAFGVMASVLVVITRQQPLVAVGRVMNQTRIVRHEIVTRDDQLTAQRRQAARQATPRVYVANTPTITAIVSSIENLPRTLAAAESLDAVDPSIRDAFALTPELLAALRAEAPGGELSSSWKARVRSLQTTLLRRPILDQQAWQRGNQEGSENSVVRLIADGRVIGPVLWRDVIGIGQGLDYMGALQTLARDAGFAEPLRSVVVTRMASESTPTFLFDPMLTAQDQRAAEEAVPEVVTVSPVGQVIFERGDVLTPAQAELNIAEWTVRHRRMSVAWRVLTNAGAALACVGVTVALAGYTVLFCPRVRRNAGRITGVAGVLAVLLAVACGATAAAPHWIALTATAPTILVAMLMAIGYERRAALAYALLHGLLVCVALREGIALMAVMVTGIACVVWSLREIRDRAALLRTAAITALGVAFAQIIFGLIERPPVPATLNELLIDAARGAGGALALGAGTLLLLPMIERAFGVTTGLSLVELRDPRQPLLRELQQRAPGTYTHSLNVATIAEAAADAVGADGLLAYVGSLYHDIGKMNKPEYFVENQQSGPNKHDRLSPAMSLLLVVGHVKDGVELAREFRLPQRLVHFIEAHHGTTLVEFFYHRARKIAQGDEDSMPDEFEYRYPGPKPRTREVAIVMIADAVESASRALPDPTPARIDQLTRGIAHKRLLDGQFDDCELTLRDLNLIVENISRTVGSMHHGRVQYPGGSPAQAAGG